MCFTLMFVNKNVFLCLHSFSHCVGRPATAATAAAAALGDKRQAQLANRTTTKAGEGVPNCRLAVEPVQLCQMHFAPANENVIPPRPFVEDPHIDGPARSSLGAQVRGGEDELLRPARRLKGTQPEVIRH